MEFTVKSVQDMLNKHVTGWLPNTSVPPCYVRETGMGKQLAIVDVRCGGYQWPHSPKVIGWKVQVGNKSEYDVVIVDSYRSLEDAICAAKEFADKALTDMGVL